MFFLSHVKIKGNDDPNQILQSTSSFKYNKNNIIV